MPNPVVLIIGVLVVGGIIAAIAYYVVRFTKGSIKLTLPRTAFNGGDTISGSFEMHTKKEIEGNGLVVRLIGVEETSHYEDGQKKTRSREIYRDEVLIEDAKTYQAGAQETYNFEIATPNMQSPEFMNSSVGQALAGVVRLLGNRTTRLKWRIETRLDAKGVDLAKSRTVHINTGMV